MESTFSVMNNMTDQNSERMNMGERMELSRISSMLRKLENLVRRIDQ